MRADRNLALFSCVTAGALLLFAWGVAVALGVGVGYDHSLPYPTPLYPTSWDRAWQMFKGACLIAVAVGVAKGAIELAELTKEADFLQRELHKRDRQRVWPVEPTK